MDGVEPIQHIYEYIEKINCIIKQFRSNYKIIVFDTNKPLDVKPFDILHIAYCDIEKKNKWDELLPEIIDKCNTLINNNNTNLK